MNAILEEAWKRQRLWSALADHRGTMITRWRSVNLLLVFLGAVCGALATQSWLAAAAKTALGALGAVALAGATVVQTRMLNAAQLRARLTARAASESIKSAVYQYLARVPPYHDTDRDQALNAMLAQIAERGRELAGEMRVAKPKPRDLPAVSDVGDYLALRARTEQAHHIDGLRRHQRLERRWRQLEVIATAIAAVLSAVGSGAGGQANLSAWVGVATTLAAAFGAHLASAQHARLAASYALTIDELERLIAGYEAGAEADHTAREFVARVEAVLARQNESWVSLQSPQQ